MTIANLNDHSVLAVNNPELLDQPLQLNTQVLVQPDIRQADHKDPPFLPLSLANQVSSANSLLDHKVLPAHKDLLGLKDLPDRKDLRDRLVNKDHPDHQHDQQALVDHTLRPVVHLVRRFLDSKVDNNNHRLLTDRLRKDLALVLLLLDQVELPLFRLDLDTNSKDRKDQVSKLKDRVINSKDHKDLDSKRKDPKGLDINSKDRKDQVSKHKDHKGLVIKGKDHKDLDSKLRAHKVLASQDKDLKDPDFKLKVHKDQVSKLKDHKDQDSKLKDHKDQDFKLKDHKDQDSKHRDRKMMDLMMVAIILLFPASLILIIQFTLKFHKLHSAAINSNILVITLTLKPDVKFSIFVQIIKLTISYAQTVPFSIKNT
jgi:hypothetical protein